MKNKLYGPDFLYTERAEGVYDLMTYDPLRKELYLDEGLDASLFAQTDGDGAPITPLRLSPATFDKIYRKLFRDDGCAGEYFVDPEEDDEDEDAPRTPVRYAPHEAVLETIRTADATSISELIGAIPVRADYYDHAAIVAAIHRFLRGEMTRGQYVSYLIFVTRALYRHPWKEISPRARLYEDLAQSLDAHSFDFLDEESAAYECREMLAYLREYDHCIRHARKQETPPFYTHGCVRVAMLFAFCNGGNDWYRICVADEEKGVFCVSMVANPDFFEEINYTFCDEEDFDNFVSSCQELYHDDTLDIHPYIGTRPKRKEE